MPSFTTIYRAFVMLAAGAIVFKGWQLYGPSAEKVKSVAVSTIDMAQAAWNNRQTSGGETRPAAEPRGAAPPFAQTAQPAPADMAIVPPPLSTQSITPNAPVDAVSNMSIQSIPVSVAPLAETSPAASKNDDLVQALLSRLEQLGGAEPKLAPWGSSGHLFRCSCRAPLVNSPVVTQHFESVAAEPALAVEQVVAQVENWRTAQRNDTVLR